MAREKAYYWIKVPINFFDDPAIDWISDQKTETTTSFSTYDYA